ncbi:MAG: hypothetical protein R3228_09585, partial [Halioglobus sp.]|nr:hypothetical protein [Halioglobus sp.]
SKHVNSRLRAGFPAAFFEPEMGPLVKLNFTFRKRAILLNSHNFRFWPASLESRCQFDLHFDDGEPEDRRNYTVSR